LSAAADFGAGTVQYCNWEFIVHDGKGGGRVHRRLHESHTKKQGKVAKETLYSDSLLKNYVN